MSAELSDELQALIAEQPSESPAAVSAWMARRLADVIVTAFRTMDRNAAQIAVEGVAWDLESLARSVDPGGAGESVLYDPHSTISDSGIRQTIYQMCGPEMRTMIARLWFGCAPVENASPILDRLREIGLAELNEGRWALTVLGDQIAEGLRRHHGKVFSDVLRAIEAEQGRL